MGIRLDVPSDGGLSYYASTAGILRSGETFEAVSRDGTGRDLPWFGVKGGTGYTQETLRVQVYDGIEWSEWIDVDLTSGRNSAPEIRELGSDSAVSGTLTEDIRTNERRRLSDYIEYFDDPTDDDRGTVQQVRLRDASDTLGSAGFINLTSDGVESAVVTNGGEVTLSVGSLDEVLVVGGDAVGSERLEVSVSDGHAW